MKKVLFIFITILTSGGLFSQSDNCATAPTITVSPTCSTPYSGTSLGATLSFAGCVGNADDDVWYKFVATATSHSINVVGSAGYDAVVEVFSGSCSGLTSISCIDGTLAGGTESSLLSGLTIGNTYYIRIFDYFAGSGSSTFSLCLTNAPAAPSNDGCAGATGLSVNAGCVNVSATSYGATQSQLGCSGTADDDVWFSFTANNYTQTIQVTPSSSMDAVLELFSGSCGALTSFTCVDNGFTGGIENTTVVGLTPGVTYYIRVYDYYASGGYSFSVCVSGAAIGAGQPNDNPCSAIQLPAVTADCNYLQFSTVGATQTNTTLAPAPFSCAGGSGAAIGGFTTTTKDVWFKITVPASGNLYITPQPNLGAGYISDGVMALYSGANCSALSQIACADDYPSYPGTVNDNLPYLAATGLTPGTTVYLRYWAFATAQGSFGICVQSPTNDQCSTALNICDLNGYAGSTSAAYTADRPCNMRGDAEFGGGYTYTPGSTPSGGQFGLSGPWGVGQPTNVSSPHYDVQINNNSWIKFTAASTTASFKVNVGNCWVGSYPSGGLQMQIFSAAASCCSFVPVSDFKENSTTFTLNANSLTVGNSYYLMIDGYAGDICNYTITALTGVSFPNITGNTPICQGGNTTLYGPAGASSYTWYPGGATTSSITVSPGSSITYTCIAGGVCGFKQTLTKQVIVNPLPNLLINSGSAISTCGTQTITLSGSGANTYTWNTGPITNTLSVAPSSNTSYTLSGTDAQGCVNSIVTTVTVNPVPSTTISASSSTICSGSNATLTAGGANTYTWNTGSTNTVITVSPASATNYTVTGTNTFGCTKTSTINIGVKSLPTINTTSTTICSGASGTLTASGGVSYVWSNGSTNSSTAVSPTTTTNYTVVGTGTNSCTDTKTTQVVVNSLPVISVNSGTACSNVTSILTVSGANTYTWSTGATGTSSIAVTPTVNTNYTVTGTAATTGCTNTAVSNITVFTIPALTSTPSLSPSNCSPAPPSGSITNVTISGTPTFTYSWTNGSGTQVGTTANLNTQPAGTYNLQVTDGKGCINSFGPYSIINPGAPAAPTASATATSLCVGGTINLFASSGAASPTYSWSGPAGFSTSTQNPTILSATNLMSGIYSVFATSAGCSGPATNVSITVNPNPSPTANSSSPSYCAGSTISLLASSGGTNYVWSGPGGFTSNLQNPTIASSGTVASGVYNLTVTSAAGCTGSTSTSVTVNPNPAINAFATNSAVCTGNAVSLNASGGTNYTWSGPNGFSSISQNPTITSTSTLSSGAYSITVSNSLTSCSSNSVINIVVNPLPVFNASALSPSVCTNSTIQLTSTASGTVYWTGPLSYTANGANQTITNATPANAGIYTISVTDFNNCNSIATVPVFVFPLTPVTVSTSAASNTFCTGNTINLFGVTTASVYSWMGPNSFVSNVLSPSISNVQTNSSGIYTLTVTDVNGCVNSNTAMITINTTPNLVSSNNGLTCVGQNVILFANFGSGATVNWYSDLSLTTFLQLNSNTYTPTFGGYGTYTFYAQGVLNGCTSSITPIIANYYNLVAGISSSTLSGVAPISVQFTNTSIGLLPGNTVNWSFGDGSVSNQNTPANTYNNPGSYSVVLTVSNGLCTDDETVVIDVIVANIFIPEVLTPNNDGHNDVFYIKNIEYFPDNELFIFNRWGNLVYKTKSYKNTWDGIPNSDQKTGSNKLPPATYFYLLNLGDKDNKTFKGFVQLMY